MAINTNTVEANLTTKLNATSGTTDAKEFLLLGKAVEALTPSVTVQDVIDQGDTEVGRVQTEGNTQVAAVQAAGSGYLTTTAAASTYAALAGATFTGAVTIPDLTVTGTTTTVNSTDLVVADKNITIASGAADAAAANGSGITVDGASANITYTSATDTWDFNKAITGTYTNLHPEVNSGNVATSVTVDMTKPMHHFTMTANGAFSGVSIAAGRTSMIVLDRSASSYTPSWNTDIKWPDATEPTWADYRYWIVSMTCLNNTTILAAASGYTV
jgi:hypothetical protein